LKGLSGQLNLVSLSFSLFFLSFSFFCGILNTRSFFDPLRARHHLREKKRAHTTTTTTTTTTKHDDANKRSKEVWKKLFCRVEESVCLNRRPVSKERERERENQQGF
jgi:hypothetical protein